MTTAKIRSFQPNGYQETIKKGLSAIHSFNSGMSLGKDDDTEQLDRLKEEIKTYKRCLIQYVSDKYKNKKGNKKEL